MAEIVGRKRALREFARAILRNVKDMGRDFVDDVPEGFGNPKLQVAVGRVEDGGAGGIARSCGHHDLVSEVESDRRPAHPVRIELL